LKETGKERRTEPKGFVFNVKIASTAHVPGYLQGTTSLDQYERKVDAKLHNQFCFEIINVSQILTRFKDEYPPMFYSPLYF
jgi:hypothetical protein